MVKDVFEYLKGEIQKRYPDVKVFLGGVIERLPSPELIDEFLPAVVLQPRMITSSYLDTQQTIERGVFRFTLYYIERWKGEPMDIDKKLAFIEEIKKIVLNFYILTDRYEIKKIEPEDINFESDLELFFRTGFIDLTGISFDFLIHYFKSKT